SVPYVELESKEGLTAALTSPNLAVRSMAMEKIPAMELRALRILEPALSQRAAPLLRIRALWILRRMFAENRESLRGVDYSGDPFGKLLAATRYFDAAEKDLDSTFR